MSMKKMLALLLALAMVFALAACASSDAGKNNDDDDKETKGTSSSSSSVDPTGDSKGDEPTVDEPTESKPVEDEPTVDEPVVDEPIDRPMPGEPEDVASVVAFVEGADGKVFLESIEQSFTVSGMTCNSTIEAYGSGIILTICINELNDVDEETCAAMQAAYDASADTFEAALAQLQIAVPEMTYMAILVCDVDGDVLATAYAGE